MAANIYFHQPRVEVTQAERDENNGEPAVPDGQASPPSETIITAASAQHGQSDDGGGSDADAHDSSAPLPLPTETETPKPSFMRYGIGDTVIIGRPNYTFARAEVTAANGATIDNGDATEPRGFAPRPQHIEPTEVAPVSSPSLLSPRQPNDPTPKPTLAELSESPSGREPYLYPGLRTAHEQSPHYAIALVYGREQGYSDDEVMKLAVLMQANRDQNMGREWLTLKPAVLRAAVNAVVRNPDNSFDTSGVFGGQRGYHNAGFGSQTMPPQGGTAADENPTPFDSLMPPEGWVLEERDTGGGDAGPNIIRYYRPSDELIAKNDIPYVQMLLSGYVQVPHGLDSELSVGADGGVHDLSRLDFHPDYGLVTTPDNIRPLDNEDGLEQIVVTAILTVATYGVFTAAAGGAAALNSGAGLLTGGTLSAAEALALSSFVGTTAATGDLRQGFIAGLASFAGSQVARFIFGPQGLQLNISPNTPWTMGNFVSSIVSGTVSGAIQGDWRRGLVNGLVSFSSNVIAHELKIPATVANAAIRALYDPQGALGGLVSGLINDPAMAGIERGAQRDQAIQQLLGLGMSREDATQMVERTIAEGGRLNTVTAQARAETQQQITWIRDAIDLGHGDTAAELINSMVNQAMTDNPNQSRGEVSARLMRELGIVPDTVGFVIGADGRVAFSATPTVDRPTAVTRLAMAYRAADNRISEERAIELANAYIDRNGIPTTFAPLRIEDIVVSASRSDASSSAALIDRLFGAGSAVLLSASISSMQATGQTLTMDVLIETAARLFGPAALEGGAWALGALAIAGTLFVPRNIGSDRMQVDLADGTRFIVGNGAIRGELQARDQNGDWQTIQYNAVLVNTPTGRVAMSEEDLQRYRGPLVNVPSVPDPNGGVHVIPPLTEDERNRLNGTTISPIPPNTLPPLEGFQIGPPQTIDDLTIENADIDRVFGGRTIPETQTTRGTRIEVIPDGNREMAERDFDALNLTNVRPINTNYGSGRMGQLSDGSVVLVRPSRDGRPTIELQSGGRTRLEVRYGGK